MSGALLLTRETAQFGVYGSGRHGMTRRLEPGFEMGSGRSRVRGHTEVELLRGRKPSWNMVFCALLDSAQVVDRGRVRHGRMEERKEV